MMMESPRHDLDAAIDRVAEQMVTTPGNGDLLQQVMGQLPERTATPWFLSMPVQATAAAALVLVAFLYARPSREVTPRESRPVAARAPVIEPQPLKAALQPVALPVPAPRSLLRQGYGGQALIADRPDHERSLPPVRAIESLKLTDIAAPAMAFDAPTTLEPLVLIELALDTKGDK